MENLVNWLVMLAGLYAAAGVVFAIAFVLKGASRIDPSAREGTWGFRVLILPGAAAFWPLLAKRWATGTSCPPEEDNPHRRAARRAS